ncbi:sensor histidine kinase [Brevibacterium limosum]|uniref:sensor histidine kinase n=1 Tax=Brevibacterium limosum TaxID=2697565 RepID=UPI0014226C7C|nr:histidine kinase [Brevibacterium limosum]
MRRPLTWLWLLPVPLSFALELLIGSGWLLILGNVLAAAVALPALIRAHRHPDRRLSLLWAVLGLLAALALTAGSTTLSLTSLWLSLVALAMLTRTAATKAGSAPIVALAVANIIVAGLMPDGLTFALMVTGLVIAAIAIGLMLRSNDRTLIEKQATATEAERRRIATELHDLIAHEVTGIVVLAEAAGRSDDNDLRTTALTKIEKSGTRALEEIRRLVSASRNQDHLSQTRTAASARPARSAAGAGSVTGSEAAARTPVAAGPQALHDRVAAFGEAAHLTIDIPAEVDGEVWPVLDRVLVESLTNVRRHAGADAEVTVTVTTDPAPPTTDPAPPTTDHASPAALLMTVTNGPGSGGIGAGSGTGVGSLRARVGHLGGSIDAAPVRGGGWSVRARVPVAAWDVRHSSGRGRRHENRQNNDHDGLQAGEDR